MHHRSNGCRSRNRRRNKRGGNSHDSVDDLTGSMGRLSMRKKEKIQVPRLSSFSLAGKAAAGKAVEVGEAISSPGAIPEDYSSKSAYLEDMKAHTQSEFEASVRKGAETANNLKGSGWLPVVCEVKPRWEDGEQVGVKLSFFVGGTPKVHKSNSGHDFEVDPWSRHAIQFEGMTVPALVVHCKVGQTPNQARLTIASAHGFKGGGIPSTSESSHTRVRSLGYVGSYLLQYGSAAELLSGRRQSALLGVVAAPGKQHGGGPSSTPAGGTFVSANADSLDTSSVPLDVAQRNAVLNLTGGLDIIVGPPGTGKSTTIWHIIDSRVAPEVRVLVTCTRNQAVDAVTEKVEYFGVLVFGSEARLGEHAKECTMDGRMRNDPELMFWRRTAATWERVLGDADSVSRVYFLNFPGIGRFTKLKRACCEAHQQHLLNGNKDQANIAQRRQRTSGRWARVLEHVLREVRDTRLKIGSVEQRRTFRQICALEAYMRLLLMANMRVRRVLTRLENLTCLRFYTKTRVLICTIDSTERMVRTMEKGTREAAFAVGGPGRFMAGTLNLDTAIMDEAGCVLESAVPVLLTLGVKNLTLVGDHHQLQPFSHLRDGEGCANHNRSLMERAQDAGTPGQFLTTQYRMHPGICEIVSKCFYDNKVVTADQLKLSRKSSQPCQWVHVNGGQVKHEGAGYSNPLEVPIVVHHARSALERYGANADVRVITFYNMQKRDLEHEFKKHLDISHVRISSVDACQGSDADVIIISTVRSGEVGYKLSGFMLDPCRVNVALSRAKEECIIVGDMDTLHSSGGAMWRSVVDHFTTYNDRK